MIEYESNLMETLEILNENKILNQLILIGSWAEYLYEKCDVISNFISTTKTEDIDFLLPDVKKRMDKVNLYEIFEKNDYISDISREGIVVFRKDNFEVEFLTRQYGVPKSPVKSEALGIMVESLGDMTIIVTNTIIVNYYKINVKIPDPVAFMLHKILINSKRGEKKEKDKLAIRNLMFYIEDAEEYKVKIMAMYDSLTDKEKKTVEKFIDENNLDFMTFK